RARRAAAARRGRVARRGAGRARAWTSKHNENESDLHDGDTIEGMTATRRSSWREHTLATLSAAGYRRGGARNAVVELLDRQDCALTAQEIDDRLRTKGRSVGRASVYRILELLTELRLVQRI